MAETEKDPGRTQDPGPGSQEAAGKRAAEYLKKWPEAENMECPICHQSDWAISNIAQLDVRPDSPIGAIVAGDPNSAYPLVPVFCTTCGYAYFINEKWVRYGGQPPSETKGEEQ